MSVLTELLQIFTELTPEIIDIYIDIFGLDSDIYYPLQKDDFFDDFGKVKYRNTPDRIKEKLLIVNFIKPDAMRGNLVQFESFFGDDRPYIITYEQKRIPPRSKIHAWLGGSKISFQTEIDRVVTGALPESGTHSTILVKQYLRPLT